MVQCKRPVNLTGDVAEQPFVIQRVFLSDVPAQYSGARAVPPLLQGSVQFTEGPGPGQGIGAEPVPTLGETNISLPMGGLIPDLEGTSCILRGAKSGDGG